MAEPSELANDLSAAGASVSRVCGRNVGRLRGAIPIRRVIARCAPDVIVTWLYDASLATRVGRLLTCSVPIVTCLQNADYSCESRAQDPRPWRRRIFWLADIVSCHAVHSYFVACSREVASTSAKALHIRPERLVVIPNAVQVHAPSTVHVSGDALGPLARLGPASAICHVGRFVPQKNHVELLKAIALLRDEGREVSLVLFGDGPLRASMEELSERLRIADSVHFLGVRADLQDLWHLAEIFVLPSLYEGSPLALLEAMGAGKACVVSDIAAHREIIEYGRTGIMVQPTANSLAHGLRLVLDNPRLRRELAREAYNAATSKLSLDATLPLWLDLFRRIVVTKPAEGFP